MKLMVKSVTDLNISHRMLQKTGLDQQIKKEEAVKNLIQDLVLQNETVNTRLCVIELRLDKNESEILQAKSTKVTDEITGQLSK